MLAPALLLLSSALSLAQLNVVPLPTNLASDPGCLLVPASFALLPAGPGGADALLAAALSRTRRALSSLAARGESVSPCSPGASLADVTVFVGAALVKRTPALGDDESYRLTLAADASLLNASTVWGALRGLETLTQLISADRASDAAGARLVVPAAAVRVTDAPRFSHRGLMVDTGRAFLPLPVLLATLDAMAYAKLNVLHLHLSDDQAFPVDSAAWPLLAAKGAMQAPSRTHVYSGADIAAVVAAATARGIRVVPEFDVPGHTASWFLGYPALESQCSQSGGFGPPMDPTLNATYDFIAALFGEMEGAFPDSFFHVGGDEVDFTCWENSPAIVAFMAARGLTPPQLQLYFEERVVGLFGGRRDVLIWEGNAGAQNRYPADANVVVNVWKEPMGNLSVLEGLVRAGRRVLYTTTDWYLDYPHLAGGKYDYHVNGEAQWQFVHGDPFANSTLTPAEMALVIGAEVCMWSPYEDATNFFPTVFPRAAAVAERLWSAPGAAVDAPDALEARMHALRCRMVARGIAAAPVKYGASCPNPFTPAYAPPYQ